MSIATERDEVSRKPQDIPVWNSSGIKREKEDKGGQASVRRMMSQKHRERSLLSWGVMLAKLYFDIVCVEEYVTIPTMMHNYSAPIKRVGK